MALERWNRVESIFQAALQKQSEERAEFVLRQCGSDGELRREVESLLAATANAGDFMERPAVEMANPMFRESAAPSKTAGQTVGPYRLLERIGAGGMGEVWKARDARLGRDVAVKFCDEQFRQRFDREARAIAALNHPNICQLYDVGADYLVMELVVGRHVSGPLPLAEALRYARQVGHALEAAHDRGIVHRDLKPGNVMLRADGTVKVLDFGLAKFSSALPHASDATMTLNSTRGGIIMGTATHMSPEQARGEEIDKRADIWAFGVLLYELLTGQAPFERPSFSETLVAVLTVEPDLSKTPAEVRRLLGRCLEKDPKKRLRDIGDAWDLLDTAPPRGMSMAAPRRFAWIAAGCFIGCALTAAGFAIRSAVQSRQPAEARLPFQFNIDLGTGVDLPMTGGTSVAISPDGTRIAYLSDGRLYTRRLDQPEAKELPGTQGAGSPYFSPDGKWIAYPGHGRLRKVSVEGGPPIDLCGVNAVYTGGAWAEDDSLIFPFVANGPLFRLPASGGTPVQLTTLDPAHNDITHRFPQALPGSRAIIFTANTSTAGSDQSTIDVLTLQDGRRKTLVRGASFGHYLPSGHLVYLSRGSLYAVPFDLTALEIRGKPSLFVDGIMNAPTYGTAEVSFSQTGVMLFRKGDGSTGETTIQYLDNAGHSQPLLGTPAYYVNPRISPDGKRLTVSTGAGNYRGLWIYDILRDSMFTFTQSEGPMRYPVWSPDSKFVIYRSQQGLHWNRVDSNADSQMLLDDKTSPFPSSITSDGKWLVYHKPSDPKASGGLDLWTVPITKDGEQLKAGKPTPFLQTRFDESNGSFAPDGRWMAYTSDEGGTYQIFVRSFPDTGRKWQISAHGGIVAVFSRSNSELFFLAPDNHIWVSRYSSKDGSFNAEIPKLWSEQKVAYIGPAFWNFDVTPDGKKVIGLVLPERPGRPEQRSHVTVMENVFDELRRLAPVGN